MTAFQRLTWFIAAAVVLWLGSSALPDAWAQGPRESLDNFPKSQIEISAADGPQHLDIWVADTTARSEQGLMYVTTLAHDWGMLFPRNNNGPMAMWMKNTLIPLDMLFVDAEGNIVYIRRNAVPQSETIIKVPAPISTPIAAVLELAGGECERRHITQGDRLRIVSPAG
ncbi:MAG TPA: DUF192 domain-containing protein [Steroidobacteraceae bacterium]|jgi:hypothetical protein|nr:DUF192 domain-containing protein [Steroidobacteraceae bacterium]